MLSSVCLSHRSDLTPLFWFLSATGRCVICAPCCRIPFCRIRFSTMCSVRTGRVGPLRKMKADQTELIDQQRQTSVMTQRRSSPGFSSLGSTVGFAAVCFPTTPVLAFVTVRDAAGPMLTVLVLGSSKFSPTWPVPVVRSDAAGFLQFGPAGPRPAPVVLGPRTLLLVLGSRSSVRLVDQSLSGSSQSDIAGHVWVIPFRRPPLLAVRSAAAGPQLGPTRPVLWSCSSDTAGLVFGSS